MPARPAAPFRALLALGVAVVPASGQPETPPVYTQSFAEATAAPDFACTDSRAWRIDLGTLRQFAPSAYEPAQRSPANIAVFRAHRVGSFVLGADLMQTGREYAHRDMCIVFAFQDSEHFCYAHLASSADEHSHGIFVVDGASRAPITTERSDGVDWGREEWHKVRVEFDAGARSVRVFFDGAPVLASDAVPFAEGYVGFGTFDDEGRFDNVSLWSDDAEEIACEHFEPLAGREPDRAVGFERLDGRIRVSIGDEHFADYIYEGVIHPSLAPVRGPGGVRMTRAFPLAEAPGEAHDHPHHTGLWWGHGDVNGADTWHEGGMRLLEGPDAAGSSLSASYAVDARDGWTGVTVLEEATFAETPSGDRLIDLVVTIAAPSDGELVLGDTKEGTIAIRTHPALRLAPDESAGVTGVTGVAVNSEGVSGAEVWGKRAAWIDYSGEIEGSPVGIAIFDHPANPRFPTWWHAREYGLVAANPFGQSAFEGGEPQRGRMVVPAGESIAFRYRFLFHRFDAAGARIADAYADWAESDPTAAAPDPAHR